MTLLEKTIQSIEKPDEKIRQQAQAKIDTKTKPLGSLGELENIAVRMCCIQQTLSPQIDSKHLWVFAGDHGVASQGVSAFPAEVTPQMVLNFLAGGAAINVLCGHEHASMKVVDIGVNYDFADAPNLLKLKVRKGTRNFFLEDAMTSAEALQAIETGIRIVQQEISGNSHALGAAGEMGIGNTTSASAIISCITGLDAQAVTGRGTGIDDARLQQKIRIIQTALQNRKPNPRDGLDLLQKIGGYEIAGITGAALACAALKVPFVLDGLICTAAGLIAWLLEPKCASYFFAGHRSVEIGQKAALEKMELRPLLDLQMRLGEGTGAVLASNLIQAACKIMCEMASFEQAGVSNKTEAG